MSLVNIIIISFWKIQLIKNIIAGHFFPARPPSPSNEIIDGHQVQGSNGTHSEEQIEVNGVK